MRAHILGMAAVFGFIATPSSAAVQPTADCREFSMSVTIDGQQQRAVGQACQQPDGRWQIVQEDAAPETPYANVPQAVYAYPYPYAWGAVGAPVFVGGSFLFVDRFGRFHHFDRRFVDHRFDHRFVDHRFDHRFVRGDHRFAGHMFVRR